MFDQQHKGKIKNDKIYRWRLELSCYNFDIIYRPGRNVVAVVYCSAVSTDNLYELHNALYHPGVTRMTAFIRSRNLPFSVEDVRTMTKACNICNQCKPHIYVPDKKVLIKATRPIEMSKSGFQRTCHQILLYNKYILTIIDEYTRFPFAIPCPDVKTTSIIKALCQIFSIFGLPAYIHSDRSSAFMSSELKQYLHNKGIATSRTPHTIHKGMV